MIMSQAGYAEQQWDLKRDKSGVQVYTQEVEGSLFNRFKGVTVVDASLSSIAALLMDGENMSNWMHQTKKVATVETLSDSERVAYMLTNLPWPVRDRELIVKNRITQDESGAVVYEMQQLKGYESDLMGKNVEVESLVGYVKATPLGDGKTELVYVCHLKPGGNLDLISGIANMLVVDTPYHTLKNVRKELEKEKYASARLDYIVEAE